MEVPLTGPQRRSGQLSPSGQSPSCSRPGGRRQGENIRERPPYVSVAAAAAEIRAMGAGVASLPALQPPLWGYEERLVPHRGGVGSGGGVKGERLHFTQAGARLPIGRGRCTVRRHRCTLLSDDKCLTGMGRVHRVHPLKNVAATCVWKSENMVRIPVV